VENKKILLQIYRSMFLSHQSFLKIVSPIIIYGFSSLLMGCILINSYFDNTFFTQNRNIILLSMGLIFILISVLAVKGVESGKCGFTTLRIFHNVTSC